jgi:hypothetical protein
LEVLRETNNFGLMIRLREKIAHYIKRLFKAIFSHSPSVLKIREENKSRITVYYVIQLCQGGRGFFKFRLKKIRNEVGLCSEGSVAVLNSFFNRQNEPQASKLPKRLSDSETRALYKTLSFPEDSKGRQSHPLLRQPSSGGGSFLYT